MTTARVDQGFVDGLIDNLVLGRQQPRDPFLVDKLLACQHTEDDKAIVGPWCFKCFIVRGSWYVTLVFNLRGAILSSILCGTAPLWNKFAR